MSAEIHRLTGAGPILTGPEPTVVVALEEMLTRAKAGEIKGIAMAYVSAADGCGSQWASGCANEDQMLATTARLFAHITRAALDG
jgi:hypothetical protein